MGGFEAFVKASPSDTKPLRCHLAASGQSTGSSQLPDALTNNDPLCQSLMA